MLTRRRLIVLGLVGLSFTYVVVGGLSLPTSNPPADGNALEESRLIQPEGTDSALWPYTSRTKSIRQRTLAINLLVHGEDERVRRAITEQTKLHWTLSDPQNRTAINGSGNVMGVAGTATNTTTPAATETTTVTPDTQPVEIDESTISWNDAHGSTRYTYIDARPAGGKAKWVDEHFQIHAGTYFGSRYHIRAYTLPSTNWTAIQIHREYWDWFRLRHTVTDIRDSRGVLEADFLDQPYVDQVSREYYNVTKGWNDGWLSEIDLAPVAGVVFLFGLLTSRTVRSLQSEVRRFLIWTGRNVRGFVLMGAVAGLYLSVRSVGIVLESTFPTVDPRVFMTLLYPVVAVGVPLVAFVLAQPFGATSRFVRLQRLSRWLGPSIEPVAALWFAVVGLAAAFVLDFGGLGIGAVPVQLVIYRVGLAFALGLIAAGASHIDERGAGLLVVGIAGWLIGLLMPLVGYV